MHVAVIGKINVFPIPRGSGETVFVTDSVPSRFSQVTELCTMTVTVVPLMTTLAGVIVGGGNHMGTVPRGQRFGGNAGKTSATVQLLPNGMLFAV